MNQLVVLEQLKPLEIFTPEGTEDILARLRKEAKSHVLDISTSDGRDQIRSLAYKIAKSKTYLDEMGKDLVADQKEKIKLVDAERKRIRDALDDLKDEIRAPLTEWENREQERVKAHEAALLTFEAVTVFTGPSTSSADVQARIDGLEALHARDWQEFAKRAQIAHDSARDRLNEVLVASRKYETEQAELERLRRDDAARKQRERDEQIKAEAAARAKAEAEEKARKQAEEEAARVRAQQEKAEQERLLIQKEKEDAEARAQKAEEDRLAAIRKAEADSKAAAEKAERDRAEAEAKAAADAKAAAENAEREKEAAEKEIAEAESRARKAEEDRLAAVKAAEDARIAAAEQAERDRVATEEKAKRDAKAAAEQAEREKEAAVQAERDRAEAARKAEAEGAAKRESDKKHRAKVNNEVLNGIVTHCNSETIDITPEIAKALVEAIAKGLIPHVKINY